MKRYLIGLVLLVYSNSLLLSPDCLISWIGFDRFDRLDRLDGLYGLDRLGHGIGGV